MTLRSEYAANLALTPTTKNPTWMQPAPIRTVRKTYGVLAIAVRHPRLFSLLNQILISQL
jgi:hypothetical protein